MSYPRLWARVYNTPLFLDPEKAKVIESVFRSHINGERKVGLMEDDGPSQSPEQRAAAEHERRCRAYTGIDLVRRDDKPYAMTKTGLAMIPVLGTLVQRGSWLDSMSGLMSYDMVASLVERASGDPEVRAVLLEIDSPGGEAYGLIDLADRVYAARKRKPMWAVANEQAYSAAYWLASSAARVYTPITGGVGSIGALMLHVDQSKRDAQMGYTYTFIHAGARKVDGNSHEPISKPALQWAQAEVDRHRQLFASAVAKRRDLSVDEVLATEAGLLTPPEALEGGYIDGVNTLIEVVAMLEAELQQPGSTTSTRLNAGLTKEISMSGKNEDKKHTDEQLEAARTTARAEGKAEGVTEGKTASHAEGLAEGKVAGKAEGMVEGEKAGRGAGIKAERERVGAILSCEEAKDRGKQALHLALQTDTSVEDAKKLLAASAKESGSQMFAQLMATQANPKVGLDGGGDLAGDKPTISTAAEIFARRKQVQQK